MTRFLPRRALLVLSAAFTLSAQAAEPLKVGAPWVRPAVVGQGATGAFMQLISTGPALRLIAARSPAATRVEIHEMKMDGEVMRMRAITGLDIPAGQTVALQSGGYHLMLIKPFQPLKTGDTVPLTLVVQDAAMKRHEITVQAPVRQAAPGQAGAAKHDHDHHGHGHGDHKH